MGEIGLLSVPWNRCSNERQMVCMHIMRMIDGYVGGENEGQSTYFLLFRNSYGKAKPIQKGVCEKQVGGCHRKWYIINFRLINSNTSLIQDSPRLLLEICLWKLLFEH